MSPRLTSPLRTTIPVMLLGMGVVAAPAADHDGVALIPQPAQVTLLQGVFRIRSDTGIRTDPAGRDAAEHLATALRPSTGFVLPVETTSVPESAAGTIRIVSGGDREVLGMEGYELEVTPQGATLRAPEAAGRFHAVQTFRQLLPPEAFGSRPAGGVEWTVPCLRIVDRPRFAWRGLMVDVSRHFLPLEDLREFIDGMAVHKLNTLHLHLTDDQGWRFEVLRYPRLTEVGSVRAESPRPGNRQQGDGTPYGPFFYTQGQLRDLVDYARSRQITIVPEIDMPGHLLSLLAAYPELSCTGGPFAVRTRWGVEEDVLCIGNPAGRAMLQDILAEVLEVFPGRFIHIGGDEVPRVRWKGCPKCQALMKQEGLANEAELQSWFNRQIEAFLGARGRRLIGWDEILEGGLTPGAAVMSWRGIEGGLKAAGAGHDVVMSPNSHLYLDYAQGRGAGEPETIGGFIPLEKVYGYEPVPAELAAGRRAHILGAQGNLWSEYLWTRADFDYNAYPRAAALAEVVWSPAEARDFESFKIRLEKHLKRLDLLNINHHP